MTTFVQKLIAAGRRNNSMLSVGIDPEPARFPGSMKGDVARIFDFCARIIDATADLVIAFKPQIAYFAANRAEDQLERTIAHVRANAPHVPVILDAKRGDIGSTAEQYAKEAFERYDVDAVTLSPFLGPDTLKPYMAEKYKDRGLFVLAKTSNAGSEWLQNKHLHDPRRFGAPGEQVYEYVAKTLSDSSWDTYGQIGFVAGATHPEEIARVRKLAPMSTLLVPGIGAQGGDEEATVRAVWTPYSVTVVNSSRAILYASSDDRLFANAARDEAQKTRDRLNAVRDKMIAEAEEAPQEGGA